MPRFWPFRRASGAASNAQNPMLPPMPERRTYVVGDVHGCLATLEALLDQISEDRGAAEADIVFVGDYMDRGPDSPGTVRRLMRLHRRDPERIHCLMGNHDKMLLDFLDDHPDAMRWLQIGGFDTLVNFNVSHLRGDTLAERRAVQAAALSEAMGSEMVAWLRARPLWWQSGNVIVVHALTDPMQPMETQQERVLLWARPDRDLTMREDGAWVVHGHTIVREPTIRAGHINVDTGAYRGKSLTAAVLDGGPVRFLSAPAKL